jgi:putative heme-binding domain-containing protein
VRIPLLSIFASAVLAFAGCSRPAAESATQATAPAAKTTPSTPPSVAATRSETAAPKTAAFKLATQTLTVPEGFTVELVAGPPLVNRPISIAFDERGRLYATDSSGNSDKADKQFELKPHRIVRLEDTDGDGRYDKSTVFAENVMFPQGALFYEGSLYVGAPPHIWKFTDTNDDGVSDHREPWFDGKSLTGCGNDLHGPYLGPEGWFYWTKGAAAEQKHTLWNGKEFVSRAAHIYRSRPDGTGLEPMQAGGMDNPVGVSFTSTGSRILSGTFFQIGTPGKRDGLIHSIYGGVYGKDQPSIVGHTRTGDLMPIMTHMGAAAPCGITTYRGGSFGAEYFDNLFVCYFNLRKISRHQMVPDGATFTTKDTDFVTSDSLDFHPTDVLDDADGSLLVVDTGGWYKICCPTSQLAKADVLGGIYRVRKTGAPKVDDARGLKFAWNSTDSAAVAKLLGDQRPYVVERAMHVLGRQAKTAVPALTTAAKSDASATRRNAVWTLARIDDPSARAAVRAALADRDASVAQAALQVVSLWRDREAVDPLGKLLASDNRALVRNAAEALGRIADAGGIDPLLAAIGRLGETKFTSTGTPFLAADRILEHSLIYALIEINRPEALVAHVSRTDNPRIVRAALVALDQLGQGLTAEAVLAWLKSNNVHLRQTAAWVVGHHSEWGGALATFFRERLAGLARSDNDDRAELRAQLTQLAKDSSIQALLGTVAIDASASADARILALRAMAGSGVKETPARWFSDLVSVLGGNDAAILREAIIAARGLPAAKPPNKELPAALGRVARNDKLPADVRLEALGVAPAAQASVEPPLFDFLCAQLDSAQPTLVRGAAATALAKVPLAPAQRLALADRTRAVGPLELPKLLPAFEKTPGEEQGMKLLAALKQSPGISAVRANILKPLFAKYPALVQQQAEQLITMINADAAKQNARVEELLPASKEGDIRRGQIVFHSDKAACTLCHALGYRGGRLGPDLTNIGKIRDERELIEAIIFPSATFVRGYEPFNVKTKSGEEVSGIVKKDAADEVVLATGPETEQRILRGDIHSLQPGSASAMPPGYEAMLSKQELADLVAFLKSRT